MDRLKNTSILEGLFLIVYMILTLFILSFHEPWFDEAQAWLIVRDNTIFDLLWHVLRYEGHTPLWYILLYVPVHLGIPFELGLKGLNFIIISISAIILVKKSPFPLVVRLLLPFTYFLFYQYGIISRSYSLLTLLLWLIAVMMPHRHDKPIRFSLLLALLGGVTAHGMLIAFGIAMAWFIEIAYEHHRNKFGSYLSTIKAILKDPRFLSLFLLGLINIIYVLILWPPADKYTPLQSNGFQISAFLFKAFMVPINGIATDVWPGTFTYNPMLIFLLLMTGFLFTILFFTWALNKGMFLYVTLPYIFTSLLISLVYFSKHHTGIYTLMIIFGIWVSLLDETSFTGPLWLKRRCTLYSSFIHNHLGFKRLLLGCLLSLLILQIYWSFMASFHDIRYPYVADQDLASFIKREDIHNFKIFNAYSIWGDEIAYSMQNIAVLSYFPQNIFYNHNKGNKGMSYVLHRTWHSEVALAYLRNAGKPDFIIEGDYPISVHHPIINDYDFVSIATFDSYYMWKDSMTHRIRRLRIHKNLLPYFPQFQFHIDN